MPSPPFVDRGTGELDTKHLITEAIPLAKLVGLVGVVALIPLLPALFGIRGALAFTLVGQFVLAVGAGLVLMYVVARGTQLAR